jgi:hypothetical protein
MSTPTKSEVREVRPIKEGSCQIGLGKLCAFYDCACPSWARRKCKGGEVAFERIEDAKQEGGG